MTMFVFIVTYAVSINILLNLSVKVSRDPNHRNKATLINVCGYKITSTLFRF